MPPTEFPVAGEYLSVHGGPDAEGTVPHDFSTNANSCGPCPSALEAIRAADAGGYPDPAYTALRRGLAAFHQVDPARILVAASASEFIVRMSAAVAQGGGRRVRLPAHAYGDYRRAAEAWHLEVVEADTGFADGASGADDGIGDRSGGRDSPGSPGEGDDLVWCCDPGSPLGLPDETLARQVDELGAGAHCVLDLAYEPLRLTGNLGLSPAQRDRVWQLWTPNKALGLTGVRAAYAIAPLKARTMIARLERLAPSWLLGAHGVALLEAWTGAAAQRWLALSLPILADWKLQQTALCEAMGWQCMPSVANFFCARPDRTLTPERAALLRQAGIRLRDTASFGMPRQLRLAVLPPGSHTALRKAWTALD